MGGKCVFLHSFGKVIKFGRIFNPLHDELNSHVSPLSPAVMSMAPKGVRTFRSTPWKPGLGDAGKRSALSMAALLLLLLLFQVPQSGRQPNTVRMNASTIEASAFCTLLSLMGHRGGKPLPSSKNSGNAAPYAKAGGCLSSLPFKKAAIKGGVIVATP